MTTTLKSVSISVVALIAVMLCIAPSMHAQAISGDLVGAITDASGGAIPNVSVTVTNSATNVKFTGVTNSVGDYRIGNLPPGSYEVSAAASGFAPASMTGVAIELNRTTTANLKLAVGAVSTSVDVSEAGVLLDTTTAQLQTTFSTKEVFELPTTSNNSGSGVYNLALLGAGVSTAGGVGQGFFLGSCPPPGPTPEFPCGAGDGRWVGHRGAGELNEKGGRHAAILLDGGARRAGRDGVRRPDRGRSGW